MKYRYIIHMLFALILLVACNNNSGKVIPTSISCNRAYSIDVTLWNNNDRLSLIGEPIDANGGYEKADGWSIDGPYFPKKFDLKLDVYNNYYSLYDSSFFDKATWKVNVSMSVVYSVEKGGHLLLNSKKGEPILIDSNIKFSLKDFAPEKNFITFTLKNIDLKGIRSKLDKSSLNLNQIVFYIDMYNDKNKCVYEYYYLNK